VSDALEAAKALLEGTEYAIVRKDRVRTLTVGHIDTQATLKQLNTKDAEDAHRRFVFGDLAMSVMMELLESGAMRKHVSPLVSLDGSRRYTMALDVLMPKDPTT
jgi:hypothetical protein